MSCQPTLQNLAIYLQGVTVTTSDNITSEYFVTGSLPSSAPTRRVWQFLSQGTITGPLEATLTLDYTQAHETCPEYNITFEGALNGTLTIHNQVFSANKFISYRLSLTNPYVLVLTIKIPKTILQCYGETTPQAYSFNLFLNDASTTCTSPLSFTTAGTYTLSLMNTGSSSVTVDYLVVGGGGGGEGSTGSSSSYAGGGGGGATPQASFTIPANDSVTCLFTVGTGGTAGIYQGTLGPQGGAGGDSMLTVTNSTGSTIVDETAGGGQGGENGQGGSSGNGNSGGSGQASCGAARIGAGGGGGGAFEKGNTVECNVVNLGGNGGSGNTWTAAGTSTGYGGGGGGNGNTEGFGGYGGGGNGAVNASAATPDESPPQSGSNGYGGGGGGGANTSNGGEGGIGRVEFLWSGSSISCTYSPSSTTTTTT